MGGVDGSVKGACGDGAGAGERLANGLRPAFAFALPDGSVKRGGGELVRGLPHAALQEFWRGEGAQAAGGALAVGATAKAGAQAGPGFADLVFIHCRVLTPRRCAKAEHGGGGGGQSSAPGAAAALAGVKVKLYVQHGDMAALHQIHLRAAGLHPVRNGRAGVRGAGGKKEGREKGNMVFFHGVFYGYLLIASLLCGHCNRYLMEYVNLLHLRL